MAKKVIEFKKFDWFSVAKISAVFVAIIAFVANIIGLIIASTAGSLLGTIPNLSSITIITSIILAPIFLGVIGFICGAICTVIYNFIASKVGGIKVEH